MILKIKAITAIHHGKQTNHLHHDWKSRESGNPNHGNQTNQEKAS